MQKYRFQSGYKKHLKVFLLNRARSIKLNKNVKNRKIKNRKIKNSKIRTEKSRTGKSRTVKQKQENQEQKNKNRKIKNSKTGTSEMRLYERFLRRYHQEITPTFFLLQLQRSKFGFL